MATPNKLNTDWLEVFVQIHKTKSVSRAASQLGMEQATASIALNKLRQYFDDRLFVRTADGMIATPRAEAIYPELLEALARLAAARGQPAAFAPADAQREFRICMTDISEIIILPRLVNHLQKQAPRLPRYKVKQHWHERFNADAGNAWLRRTVAGLFMRSNVQGRAASH